MNQLSEEDELLSYNTEAVAEASVRRPPISDAEGDCTNVYMGTGFEGRRQIVFHMDNGEFLAANPPMEQGSSFEIRVNAPAKAGEKPRSTSVLGGMLLAAEESGIGDNPLAFKGKRIHWHGKARTLRGMEDPFWQWTPSLANNNGVGGGVGVPQEPAAEPSAAAIAAALELLAGKDEAGFQAAAIRSKVIQADKALIQQISSGAFTKGLLESGAATLDEEKVFHVVEIG